VGDGSFDAGALRGDELVEPAGVHAESVGAGAAFGDEEAGAGVGGIGEASRSAVGVQSAVKPLREAGFAPGSGVGRSARGW